MSTPQPTHTAKAPWAVLITLVLLSSCGFAYKPTVTGTNKCQGIYTIPFESHHLNMVASVDRMGRSKSKDTAAFIVFFWTDATASGPAFTINSLKVSLRLDIAGN